MSSVGLGRSSLRPLRGAFPGQLHWFEMVCSGPVQPTLFHALFIFLHPFPFLRVLLLCSLCVFFFVPFLPEFRVCSLGPVGTGFVCHGSSLVLRIFKELDVSCSVSRA